MKKTGHMRWRDCSKAHLYLCVFSVRFHELTWAVSSPRRINQASATWPRWLWTSCAQLIRVPCGPKMKKTKKHEEWEECRDRKNSRQWMIMMTRAILLASVSKTPYTQSHPPPWPWPWLPHGRVIWLRSACQCGWSVTTRQGLVCQLLGMTESEKRTEDERCGGNGRRKECLIEKWQKCENFKMK